MKQIGKRGNTHTTPNFLQKTYEMLENQSYQDIISWNEEGNAFIVKNVSEFSEKILPNYFKHNNFSSFVRQLNMYDFHKTRSGGMINEFRHKLFRKGYKKLLSQIKRKVPEQIEESEQLALAIPMKPILENQENQKQTSQFLMKEMATMKNKQENLEKVCTLLLKQNQKMLHENKQLWNHIIQEKYEWIQQYFKYQRNQNNKDKIFSWLKNQIRDSYQDEEDQFPSIKTRQKRKMLSLYPEENSEDIDLGQVFKKYKKNPSLIKQLPLQIKEQAEVQNESGKMDEINDEINEEINLDPFDGEQKADGMQDLSWNHGQFGELEQIGFQNSNEYGIALNHEDHVEQSGDVDELSKFL